MNDQNDTPNLVPLPVEISELTTSEKADLITGAGIWTTRTAERLGVPALTVTDGPNGARGGGLLGTGTATACIPAGAVLGATWDPHLVVRLGQLLGEESRAKGANVLLAPTINLHRHSLGGRNFECYSEDPLLSGRIAAAFINGVQSQGVATTAKHFVGNDSEFERNSIDVQVDERTLREVYLLPFEIAVSDGGAWGIMSAYNRLNGVFCSEHEWLMQTVLRGDWGFDGFVVSDWFALRSTAASIKAGLSLEMPGPGKWYGPARVTAAIEAGDIDEAHLDPLVEDMVRALQRTGAFDGRGGEPERELDRPEDRELMRAAAAAGTVMLRNDGVLPLDPSELTSVAVLGPNARAAKVMGGGSAQVNAYRLSSPLDALQQRLGSEVDVQWAMGSSISRSVEPVGQRNLDGDVALTYFSGHDLDRDGAVPAHTSSTSETVFTVFGEPAAGMGSGPFSIRASTRVQVEQSGTYGLSMVQAGRGRVLLDGAAVLDGTQGSFAKGDSFFGFGSEEIACDIDLEAGQSYELVMEYDNREVVLLAGMRVGLVSPFEVDLMAEAVQLAAASDVAIVVVGTNDDWETEGRDRDLFELPGDQPELIRQVAAVNDRTVVVVNAGGPHGLHWIDAPAAVLNVGFGGQELGEALVDILVGDVDPGGRMPYTVPADYAHSPALPNYPGENSVVRYGEGLFIGHRWFVERKIAPAAVFGEGLSYASFSWDGAQAPAEVGTDLAQVLVSVPVTNTSDRSGSDVVQLYIEPPATSGLPRPSRELKAFAKLHLAAGETQTAELVLDARSFAYFDPGDPAWEALLSDSPVPAGEGASHRTRPGWYVEPGDYHLIIARSALDEVERVRLLISGEERWIKP